MTCYYLMAAFVYGLLSVFALVGCAVCVWWLIRNRR